jgi:solute:Na+ symporter, SSS family
MLSPQLSLTTLDWIVCITGVAGSILTGLWLSLRAHSTEDSEGFFLAGRSLLWPVVGASLYATNIGAEHLVGLSGDSYRYGLKAGAVELGTAITLGITCWVLLPTYVKARVFTIPEFLEMRYDVRARVFFAGLMMVICIMTKMAFTLFAGALVLNSLLGWDVMQVVLALAILSAAVTMIGGFMTVAYTDAIQTLIMVVGCSIMLAIGIYEVGGWGELVAKAGEKIHVAGAYDDPTYPFWGIIAGTIYGGVFYWGMDQVNVQRLLGAKDLDHGRWGAMFSTLLKLTPIFIFAMPGVIASVLYPGLDEQTSKQTFVVLLNNLLPSGIRGLVLSALLAALISSLLAVMNSVSTMAVRDFLMRFTSGYSEKHQVRFGQAAILVGALCGVAAAYLVYKSQEGLYKYLQTISVYLVLPVAPAIFFGVVSKRINMTGAICSVAAGATLAAVYFTDNVLEMLTPGRGKLLLPFLHYPLTENYTYRGLWATLTIIVVLYAVSYATAPPPREKVDGVTYDWSAPWEPFRGIEDWRLQLGVLSLATLGAYAWLW